MAPSRPDDDWSDSDEEELDQLETSVLLGVPDGQVDVDADMRDAAVSRIGGLPVRGHHVLRPAECIDFCPFSLSNIIFFSIQGHPAIA